tara:strand:- start:2857 stop:4035 length:1179 start_codon:yes stop_codon:yes gene_type:complete
MAVQIPTLVELFTSIKGDLEGKIGVTIPIFGKAYLNGLAGVQAAKIKLIYLAIANLQKNVFPDLAESESIGGTLERFGRVKLNRNPFAAKAGQYTVSVTGQIGATIKVNTTFKSDDSSNNPSKLYILDNAFTFTGTTGTITLRALEGGLGSSLNISDTLTATAPILNADEIGTISSELIQPLAAEDLEDYRAKIVEAFRLEPEGGAGSDYRLWSNDAQGVRTVYPYAKVGFPNEIELFVESTIANSTDSKGTPSSVMLDDVDSVVEFDPDTTAPLNERGRRPLAAFFVDVKPVSIKNIDITITGFQNLTPTKQTTILNALNSGIDLIRPFVPSVDILSDRNDILNDSKITFFILNAESATFSGLSFTVNGAPQNSITFTNGDIPFLNSVTYV